MGDENGKAKNRNGEGEKMTHWADVDDDDGGKMKKKEEEEKEKRIDDQKGEKGERDKNQCEENDHRQRPSLRSTAPPILLLHFRPHHHQEHRSCFSS